MSQRVTVELPDELALCARRVAEAGIAGSRMRSSSGFAKPLSGWRLKPCPTMNCIVLHGLASHRGCGRSLALRRLSGHGFCASRLTSKNRKQARSAIRIWTTITITIEGRSVRARLRRSWPSTNICKQRGVVV